MGELSINEQMVLASLDKFYVNKSKRSDEKHSSLFREYRNVLSSLLCDPLSAVSPKRDNYLLIRKHHRSLQSTKRA